MSAAPLFFGIRHLSPAGAYHLRQLLTEKKPKLVLIEGPEDFNEALPHLTQSETRPPIAILAYTQEAPVQSLLYPLAEYSPEYQAVRWCQEADVPCRFIDLPSGVFLALAAREREAAEDQGARFDVYAALDERLGEEGQDTFWERTLEHAASFDAYRAGAQAFGGYLRALSQESGPRQAENTLREAYMSRRIVDAIDSGLAPEDIVVVTGAYHLTGLEAAVSAALAGQEPTLAATDEEIAALPCVPASHTLMPYSYYRLSQRSGYGAGNQAPAYYGLLWEALCAGEPLRCAYSYLSRLACYQRQAGTPVSSAAVIEAVRLAAALAALRSDNASHWPTLRDLQDAAVTTLAEGAPAAISLARADTEIGTSIGALAEGVSRTSMQEDFYRQLKLLKLEKYRAQTPGELALDLRENRTVKSQQAAFLDLHRSRFLHQLRVLGISFAKETPRAQDTATWAEHWVLRWTPEAEIELVEAALKGDTISQAASFELKERVENNASMAVIASVIEDAFTCGMPAAVRYATKALQASTTQAAALDELAATAYRLSTIIAYGSIRQLDDAPLLPILQQIFYRACLLLPGDCICDDGASKALVTAIDQLNRCDLSHDFLAQDAWLKALAEVARRDDLNTVLSGLATAILLERGQMDNESLSQEVSRRLSPGVPADLGAGWFEGLALKNRYALIARLSLWESLDYYLASLDEEAFKRAAVFLRRAFADFTAAEKDAIAENLGEIGGLNQQQVSETLNSPLPAAEAQALLDGLDDFDFDF